MSDDACKVQAEPMADRAKAGNIGQMTADCQEGFSCVQSGHRKRKCKNSELNCVHSANNSIV